jgi:DNA polymerase III psi subunit
VCVSHTVYPHNHRLLIKANHSVYMTHNHCILPKCLRSPHLSKHEIFIFTPLVSHPTS